MKKSISIVWLAFVVVVGALVGGVAVSGQSMPGQLTVFADLALFSGNNQPMNCFTMNRFKPGQPVGFRVSVVDGATGQPAADAEVVVHLTYGGQTVDVPARYRGAGRGNLIPNLWSAKWVVPADAPTGVVAVTVTAVDKAGRSAEWKPFPNAASHLTIVSE